MTRKPGLGPLLLAGIAAFGAYKYSKMSSQEKANLKNKGKKFMDDNLGGLKNMFGGKQNASSANNGTSGNNNSFTPSNSYTPQG
jgi:hypothetical protein